MKISDVFQSQLKTCETNLKTGIDRIRYELATKGLSKTPAGTDIFIDQSTDLLSKETLQTLDEIKAIIYKPKEWEPIRKLLTQFIDEQCKWLADFLVNDWKQPSPQILNQINLVKSSIKNENSLYIDKQKIKLSKGERLAKDLMKIIFFGIAAGTVGFLLKIIFSR